jgi:hypothetical protein
MKKRILIVLMIVVSVAAVGFSKKDIIQSRNFINVKPKIATKLAPTPPVPLPTPISSEIAKKLKIVLNKDLTLTVKKEKHVLGGQIYVQNNIVIGAIVMDTGATASYAKIIGQKYLKLIKKKYKNTRINIQLVSNSKSLYTIDTIK